MEARPRINRNSRELPALGKYGSICSRIALRRRHPGVTPHYLRRCKPRDQNSISYLRNKSARDSHSRGHNFHSSQRASGDNGHSKSSAEKERNSRDKRPREKRRARILHPAISSETYRPTTPRAI